MYRLLCFLCLFFFLNTAVAQQQDFLSKQLIFKKKVITIKELFDEIEKHEIITAYNPQNIKLDRKIKLEKERISIAQILVRLKEDYHILTKLKPQKIIFKKQLERYTISGFIKEKESAETLVGATISLGSNQGTLSNSYGFYSITLPEGEYEISVSYIGYLSQKQKIILNKDLMIEFLLENSFQTLSDVIITPNNHPNAKKDFIKINLERAYNAPTNLGNDDIINRLQNIAGTTNTTGFSELLVRGGNTNENLVLLDGVPVYNYNHFPGLLSIFNTEALKTVDFYKGLFPAKYGGRLSSVTDIKMKDGNMKSYHIGGNINLATISFFVEGPIKKEQSSFILSGRRSWLDAFSGLLKDVEDFSFHLQDLNLKVNYILSPSDRIYFSAYTGHDQFKNVLSSSTHNDEKLKWGNTITALRWNHIFSEKVFSNTLVSFSKFENESRFVQLFQQNEISKYYMDELNWATNIEYFSDFYELKTGVSVQKNIFKFPIQANTNALTRTKAFQWKGYIENRVKFTSKITANIGLNYTHYDYSNFHKHFFQPRLILKYMPSSLTSYSIGFSEMHQFTHQLSPNSINFPYSFRLPSAEKLLPSSSKLYEFNFTHLFRGGKDKLSLSSYFKQQRNILTYRPGQNLLNKQLANGWEDQVLSGLRKVIGYEASYHLDLSPLLINLTYTYTDNKEKFKTINQYNYYPNAVTPKHIFKLYAEYNVNTKHSFSLSGSMNSGQYITLPLYKLTAKNSAHNIYMEGKTNAYQLKNDYQIDFGYTLHLRKRLHEKHTLKFGIFSLIGKPAPFYAYASILNDKITIQSTALPSLLPYFSYSFKF